MKMTEYSYTPVEIERLKEIEKKEVKDAVKKGKKQEDSESKHK